MINGLFRKMRVEWKMSIFRLDHGKDEAALIPKYDGFCTMPSHTDYCLNVNNFYTAEGERLFCERHNCRIYPDNRGIYWHFKVADYQTYILPVKISRAYLNREISIRDVYVHWRKNIR